MAERMRGRRLQRRRDQAFNAQPLCVMCLAKGYVTAAEVLDHVLPLCKGGPDTIENTQPLCRQCHIDKTAADLNRSPKIKFDASQMGR